MTLKQFEMHRFRLYTQLVEMLDDKTPEGLARWDVQPRYDNEIMFEASMDGVHLLTCVSPRHRAALHEEESAGSPTWWWHADLEHLQW